MFLFMLLPATPLPTAAHVLEAVLILVAAQMVIGRKSLWLPEFLTSRIKLEKPVRSKFMKKIIKAVRWTEKKAGPYGVAFFHTPLIDRILGLVIIIFTVGAFVAPPFSGLDTLPSIGVVLISLSILLENVFLLTAGLVTGAAGVVLSFFLAQVVLQLASKYF